MFNSSLLSNKEFVYPMTNHLAKSTTFLYVENIFDDQIRWEIYEIRNFSIHFSVSEAKKRNQEINTLENETKTFEENFTNSMI